MTKSQKKNIAASVRARLLNLARQRGDDFQLLLIRYANERLLFRLASSPYGEQFVLKGASLFTLWTGQPHRATRDIDLLGFGDPAGQHLRAVFTHVLSADVPDDGVLFDLSSLSSGPIREGQAYGGTKIEIDARVANALVHLKVDIGFGDAITPDATLVEFPSLLDFPPPHLRTYPRETVVSEKLDAIVQLGLANSRMKDFYDRMVLAKNFDFDGVHR
ncbi:nucleotidyl transferase AbiEii/AbiGii toxin family protein [Myxococcota bacterium]|nr:nucleotidyl transferase AbiEii/AbiGii toxin family protein [Myxococcota bacterium]MBU1535233.1 nucleotidyl transferase AbiEii/AbiGii toxin family protein [Myxococcota bacterium]